MHDEWDDAEQQNWLARNATLIATLLGSAGAVVGLYFFVTGLDTPTATAPPQPTLVELRPPPPPPPPPEIEEEEPEIEEIDEEEIVEPQLDEPEPIEEPLDNVDEPPPAQLGLDAEGTGSGDAFGLLAQKGGSRLGRGGSGRGGDLERWYRGVVQLGVASALRRHDKLRYAEYPRTPMHVWVDSTGRIVRVRLLGSTGDPDLDRVLESEALQGLRLNKPPPSELLGGPGGQLRLTVRTRAVTPETG